MLRFSQLTEKLLSRTAVALTVAAAATLAAGDAPAWPPLEHFTKEDMADPSNWPNDPGYAYDEDHDGQWHDYSFIPDQTGSDVTLRPDEVPTA